METFNYLKDLAISKGALQVKGEWAKLGLEHLEIYTSNLAAAFFEGLSKKILKTLVSNEAFMIIVECTHFISANLPNQTDTRFNKAWESFSNLVEDIKSNGQFVDDIEPQIVIMLLSSIILRSAFGATLDKTPLEKHFIKVEDHHVALIFIKEAKAKAVKMSIPIDLSRDLAHDILFLPEYLNAVRKKLNPTRQP